MSKTWMAREQLLCLCLIGYLCCNSFVSGTRTTDLDTVKKLHVDLLSDYNTHIRPLKNQDKPLRVEMGLALIEVADLDVDTGNVIVNTWMSLAWQDEQLRWNAKEYQGTNQIRLPVSDIWMPDIRLYNGLDAEVDDSVNAVIANNGQVTVLLPAKYEVTCHHEFRGNVWQCPFVFGSWTYNGFEMDLVALNDDADLDTENFIPSDYYTLVGYSGQRTEIKYPCCREPNPSMQYNLKVRGKIISRLGRRRRR